MFIIDGLNICRWQDQQRGSISGLLVLLIELLKRRESFICIFDANARYVLPEGQPQIYEQLLHHYPNYFTEVPGRTRADDFILQRANTSNATVISNDQFKTYESKYPWIRQQPHRLIKGKVIANGLLIPDLDIDVAVVAEPGQLAQRFINLINTSKGSGTLARSPMPNFYVYDENRQQRGLSEKIGGGGQGDIFTLDANPNIVVKVYHPDKLMQRGSELRDKIKVQVGMRELIKHDYLAWPQIEVFNSDGAWIGYAMRRASGVPLSKLAHPKLYQKYFPNLNRIGIVEILLHLLETIEFLHNHNIYVGDVNLDNVLCNPTSLQAYLIDTDSYQIQNSAKIFHCPVGRPEMTPLEHQGRNFRDIVRTAESDLFSLAILMFQCLMIGRYPYDSIGGGNPVENLRNGNFPYGRGGQRPGSDGAIPIGPWYIIWSHLTYKVKNLFIQTFKDGAQYPRRRATVLEWKNALTGYRYAMQMGYNDSSIRPANPKPSRDDEYDEDEF